MIKTYPWQCMECKTCIICGQPHHEEEMMFCDVCDRGYHTFCVGLDAIPSGNKVRVNFSLPTSSESWPFSIRINICMLLQEQLKTSMKGRNKQYCSKTFTL